MTTTQHKRLPWLVAVALAMSATGTLSLAYGSWQQSPPKTAGPIRVTALPQTIWIEAGDTSQSLNFDFLVENLGPTPLGLDSIEVAVLDTAGKSVLRRFIDGNGFAPAIETIPAAVWPDAACRGLNRRPARRPGR